MMKRLKALLLSLSMLIFSAVPSIPASADTDAIVTDGICTSVTRAAQGDEFYVYIKVPAQNSKADSVSIHVSFEEDVFEAISLKTCVENRLTYGAPGSGSMKQVIEEHETYLLKYQPK